MVFCNMFSSMYSNINSIKHSMYSRYMGRDGALHFAQDYVKQCPCAMLTNVDAWTVFCSVGD